jgi:geranylgeranyl pyrophosphate synthase
VERYMEWARLTSGASFALAARMGARLAGAHHTVESSLGSAGTNLGIAVQICEDILALRRQDPIAGGAPWRTLEQRRFGLPVLLAAEEERRIASSLAAAKARSEWESAVELIVSGESLTRAAVVCLEHAESAKRIAVEVAGLGGPFEELCALPARCLAARRWNMADDISV